MGKIIITRDSGFTDRVRKYKVNINGENIGTIGNGETKEFKIEQGNYELFLKIDWCRSNKIIFENDDNDSYFDCGSSLRGIKLLFTLIYIIFMPHKYIWLKNASNK